jgi:hypothetical protein
VKDKATIIFSRLASGEVTGEILNEEGFVVSSRSFGIMSEAEYRKILELMQIEHPDIATFKPIEITGN